jgi:tetratricopeptide (TPR) repeat protein
MGRLQEEFAVRHLEAHKAIDRYQKALARDPKFAAAYAGTADAYSYLAENFVAAPREVMPKAKEAAMRALDQDGNSAEAHTSLGIVKLDYERDRDGG